MRTLVVIPTFNEAENIANMLRLVHLSSPGVDVLVVDDSSPDGTGDIVEEFAAGDGRIRLLRRAARSGLGSAYRTGFQQAIDRGYDVVVEMDADLSHDPARLPALLAAVAAGADLAIGSRYVAGGSIPNWSWHRRRLSRWGNRYAGAMLDLGVLDATAGYRAYRCATLARLDLAALQAEGYAFQIEMTHFFRRQRAKIVEIPIAFTDRQNGESKMSSAIVVEAMVLVTWWALRDRVLKRNRRPELCPSPVTGNEPSSIEVPRSKRSAIVCAESRSA